MVQKKKGGGVVCLLACRVVALHAIQYGKKIHRLYLLALVLMEDALICFYCLCVARFREVQG